MSKEDRDDSECVCSVGMKLTWDINDPKLPQDTKQFDPFQEWTDGYVRFIYNGEDKNAQRHLSGWAMRNTNNHNCQILKKSCLGVVVCSRNCSLQDGTKMTLRPAICDKARQKQQKKLCPSCNSSLELLACRGHSGYPVTNFWRIDAKAIFFQSKGVHDHPRPESKAETEARRSAVKRRITSPPFTPKRRLLDTEGRYELGSSLLSCDPVTDRFSIMESQFPLQGQHFPAFQSPEPYYTSHHALGEQKARDPRLYVTARPGCHGYDFPYLGGYPENTADPRTFGTSCSSSSAPLCSSSSSYDPQGSGVKPPPPPHPGWKQLLKSGAPYGELPATANHHYYTPEYSCRYPAHPTNPPGGSPHPSALQTIITTTTKVSYQHCPKPPSYQACPTAPGCPTTAPSASSKPPCSSSLLDEASSSSPYSTEMKMTSPDMKMTSSSDDSGSGVIKSLAFQPENNVSTKPERVEPYDYRYSYPNYRYDEY